MMQGKDGAGMSRAMFEISLIAMPFINLPPIGSPKQNTSDRMTDRLQHCMKAVHELALTISCALETLHGHEKTGSSDIHGSYEKLSNEMACISTHVQCDQCKQNVAWSHFEPARSGIGQHGACKCRNPTPPPPEKLEGYYCLRDTNKHIFDAEEETYVSQSLETASQNGGGRELGNTAVKEPEAQAHQLARTSDASSLPTAPLSPIPEQCGSAHQHQISPQVPDENGPNRLNAREPLSLSTRICYPTHPMIIASKIDHAPLDLAPRPSEYDDDKDFLCPEYSPTHSSGQSYSFDWASNQPADYPGQSQSPRLSFPAQKQKKPASTQYHDKPTIVLPHDTQPVIPRPGGRKTNSRLSQEAKDRSPRMRSRVSVSSDMTRHRPRCRKSTGRVEETCDDRDDLGGRQQRHQKKHTEGHATRAVYYDPVGDSVVNGPLGSDSNDRQSVDGHKDVANKAIDHPVQRDDIDSIRSPRRTLHHSPSSDSRRQTEVSMSEQPSQHLSTQRQVSPPASNEVQLTDLEAQNKERLLTVRKDQSHWDKQNIWALYSDSKKKDNHSVEEKKNIKVRYQRTY